MFTPHQFTLSHKFSLLQRTNQRYIVKIIRPDIVDHIDSYTDLMRWLGDSELWYVWYYPPRNVEKMDGTQHILGIVSICDDAIAIEFKLRFAEFIESYEFVIDTDPQS